MIDIPINADIGSYEPRLFWVLTKRQLICLAIALPLCLFLYMGTTSFLARDIAGVLVFTIAAAAGAFGWGKPYGLPMERFLQAFIYAKFQAPEKRPYMTVNRHKQAMDLLADAEAQPEEKPVKKEKYKVSKEAVK